MVLELYVDISTAEIKHHPSRFKILAVIISRYITPKPK
jgi:hypothetical protein